MNRKVLIAIFVVFLILGVSIGFVFYSTKRSKSTSVPFEEKLETAQVLLPSKDLSEYSDPSGFTFKYPSGTIVKQKEIIDQSVYSDLELVSSKTKGSIAVRVVDSKIFSLSTWMREGGITSYEQVKDVQFVGIPAREVKVTGRKILAALDQSVLFTIEVVPQENVDYWESVYKTLLSTFTFTPQDTSKTDTVVSGEEGGDVIFEGEEIVE